LSSLIERLRLTNETFSTAESWRGGEKLLAKKKTSKKKKKATVETDDVGSLVVASKIKAYLKAAGVRVSGEIVEAADRHMRLTLKKAVKRARGNKRSTVRSVDL